MQQYTVKQLCVDNYINISTGCWQCLTDHICLSCSHGPVHAAPGHGNPLALAGEGHKYKDGLPLLWCGADGPFNVLPDW